MRSSRIEGRASPTSCGCCYWDAVGPRSSETGWASRNARQRMGQLKLLLRRIAVANRTFTLQLVEPVDVAVSLEVFRRPGDDLLDRYDGHRLTRTVPTTQGFVPYSIRVR